MITEFYRKALPSNGVYCVAAIDPVSKIPRHKFVESTDDIMAAVNQFDPKKQNIFVALSSFSGYSRKAADAVFVRSFFVDLDVGEGKGYDTKEEASKAVDSFVLSEDLPPPIKIDSGGGIHAYWLFDKDIPADEWKPYAEKFKDLCIKRGLKIDPVVTADLARILRCPETFNLKTDPPSPTKIIDDALPVYSFGEFKDYLGAITDIQPFPKVSSSQMKLMKLDNFQSNFAKIKQKGCAQINYVLENAKSLPEPLWYSALSIAQHCEDRDSAIHEISKGYPSYNAEETEKKALQTEGMPHSCDTFNSTNPGVCNGCSHRGKITNPLSLGKVLQVAKPEIDNSLKHNGIAVGDDIPPATIDAIASKKATGTGLTTLPDELYPFVYGKQGGIYYMPMVKYDDDGQPIQQEPELVTIYDVFPTKRIYSPHDGDCLLMKVILPHDPEREFLMPMKCVYAIEKLKETLAGQGVLFNPDIKGARNLMNYLIKWGHYLASTKGAETMRMQMGWTEDRKSFVVGEHELTRKGKQESSPSSPLCKGIAKYLNVSGDYLEWKRAANRLNQHTLELHAFTLLTGFGSALMNYTSTSGVTLCLTGESGAAKTGALYGSLSVWGNPKDLSVLEATGNGMTGRYLGLHNIPFGLDEVGNILPKDLSQLIHKVSQGKSKIRMQASVNAERDHEMSASLIAIFTSNHSLYDKLSTLKKDPNGEVARLIEFSIKKPKLFKDDATMGREIFDKFRFNYGHAGRDFIFSLYKHSDTEVQHMMEAWITKFRGLFGEDTSYRFYENLIAATMTAGEIALQAHIVDYDLDRIFERIVSELIAIRDGVVKVNQVDYAGLVGEFIMKNQTGMLAFNKGTLEMEPRTALMIRAELDNNLMFISKPDFRKFLSENMVSSREIVNELNKIGIQVTEVKKRMGSGWKDAAASTPVMAYRFPLDSFDKILETISDNA